MKPSVAHSTVPELRLYSPQPVSAIGLAAGGTTDKIEEARLAERDSTPADFVPFDLQPVLKGQFIELRPLRSEDFHDLYSVAADPGIWVQHPNKDRYKQDVFTEFFREALESGGALIAADSIGGRIIGSSRFHGFDEGRSEIEIGWTFLARSHWGGIYNGEMKRLMLRHAFRFVRTVVFLIGSQNFRSQRAIEKIGAVRSGSRRDATGRDSLLYQITADSVTSPAQ